MNINLDHKNALISGSTAGIGKAVAIELASLGATVTLLARNENKLKQVLELLPTNHKQQHNYLVADFNKPEELQKILSEKVTKTYHILLNNTGGPKGGLAIDANVEEYENAFKQHLICNQVLVQALVPGMKTSGYGRIINIISTSVKQPIESLGVSNTIRGAVANWSKTLATELGPFKITVNNVLPGATATERLTSILHNVAKKINGTYEEAETLMKNVTPAKRFAQPQEIAYAVAFLAGESASYINGINLPVDGGRTKSL
ncbi:MAG: SDR family oxidoreductase [Flavobacteriales bacterium]